MPIKEGVLRDQKTGKAEEIKGKDTKFEGKGEEALSGNAVLKRQKRREGGQGERRGRWKSRGIR